MPLPIRFIRTTALPRAHYQIHNSIHILSMLHLRKDSRPIISHLLRVPLHHPQIRPYSLCQIRLIHHEQITLRYPWSAFPWDLVASTHVDNVDDEVCKLATVVGRKVITTRLDKQEIRVEAPMQTFQRGEIRRYIFPDCRVRAASSLDSLDALGGKSRVTDEKFAVLSCEDIVCDGSD